MAKEKNDLAALLLIGGGAAAIAAMAAGGPGSNGGNGGNNVGVVEYYSRLKVLDYANAPLHYATLVSSVHTQAVNTTKYDADASFTFPEDAIVPWVQHVIGIAKGDTFEAEIRVAFHDTYDTAAASMVYPGFNVHKHADANYTDHETHQLLIPALFRKGQTIHMSNIAVNVGVANGDIQFITLMMWIPLNSYIAIDLPHYNPNASVINPTP